MDKNYNISGISNHNGAMIGVILVLILSAILAYVKPSYFKFLFKSFLGNLIVAFIVIVIGIVDIKWGIGLAAVSFIIYQAFQISCVQVEGFNSDSSDSSDSSSKASGVSSDRGLFPEGYPIPTTSIWPQSVIKNFMKFQKIHNPNLRFDLDILQKQATAKEAQELMKNGKWSWSADVKKMYKQAIAENNIINTEPGASLENAQTVYNQAAIIELLSWNSKEGSFLLNGAIIGHTPDMPENVNNLVRCGKDSSTGDISMQKIQYTGYNGIYGNMNSTVTPVKNSDLPTAVNGFKFLGSECNPCVALSNPADYSCPFSLNTGNGSQVSPVWQKLWGVDAEGAPITATATATDTATGAKKTTDLKPQDISGNFNKKDFPLLYQLKDEIMKSASFVNVSFKKPTSGATTSQGIGTISGSSVPAILSNDTHDATAVNYGPKNFF